MQRFSTAVLSAAVLGASLVAGPVMARQSAPAAPAAAPSAQPQAAAPSDAQLQKFVGASQKVAVIANEYRPRMQAAKDDTARKKVYEEADGKMQKVVHADGLTVDEFNGIGQAVQQDPKLQERAMEIAKRSAPQQSSPQQSAPR